MAQARAAARAGQDRRVDRRGRLRQEAVRVEAHALPRGLLLRALALQVVRPGRAVQDLVRHLVLGVDPVRLVVRRLLDVLVALAVVPAESTGELERRWRGEGIVESRAAPRRKKGSRWASSSSSVGSQARSGGSRSTKGQPSPPAPTLLTMSESTVAGRMPRSATAMTMAYISARFPKFRATAMGMRPVQFVAMGSQSDARAT